MQSRFFAAVIFTGATLISHAAIAENSLRSLVWQIGEDKDLLTNKSRKLAVTQATFSDGSSVDAFETCSQYGVVLVFNVSKEKSLISFAWKNNVVRLKVTIDNGPVRDVYYPKDEINQAEVLFYYPPAAQKFINGVAAPKPGGLLAQIPAAQDISKMKNDIAREQFLSRTAGNIDDLAKASSIRLQLELAGGAANVVEINPSDFALKTIAQQCYASLR
jgi:hypothetical protein